MTPGTRFGPYEVQTLLGAGGMGEVYRARDTRLGRDVALKILPAHLSDTSRRERFEREARAIAALNHPHICTIHDVGHEAGVDFLVMELIDGESLANWLARGPLPLEQALALAMDIADGLARAHRQGIVHRDLKPSNVMVPRSGSGRPHVMHAKVLDFGLAGIVRPDGSASDASMPTTAAPLTESGAVLGTPQYMAPEQIEGRQADARTDIFAFGALLFKMVTGRRAFEASTAPSLAAAILKGDPPSLLESLPAAPRALDRLVRTCLEKDPDDRFASMHDVLLELRWIVAGDDSDPARLDQATRRVPRWLLAALTAGVVLTAAAAGYWSGRSQPVSAPVPEDRLAFTLLPMDDSALGYGLALSPDGRTLAAVAEGSQGRPNVIWLRHLHSDAPTRVDGTEGAIYPFWSPDGRAVAFFAKGGLRRVDAASGAPVTIGDVEQGRGGTWLEDGTIVFASMDPRGLMRIPAGGGTPTLIVPREPGSGITNFRFPVAVGPRHFVYLALADEVGDSELRLARLDAPDTWVTVVRTQRAAAYANGFLFFDHEGVIVAQRFDPQTGELTGERVPLPEYPGGTRHIGYLSFTANGRTIAWRAQPQSAVQFTWLDRDGGTVGTLGAPGPYTAYALSADDRRLAVAMTQGLWIMDAASGARQEVARAPMVQDLRWARNSSRVAFVASRGPAASLNLYSVAIAQPFSVEPLAEAPLMLRNGGWTPDGRFVWLQPRSQTVRATAGAEWFNLRGVLMREPGAEPTLVTEEADRPPLALSPDGERIAYPRRLGGQWEVCLDTIASPPDCQPVEWSGTTRPTTLLWRSDGRELIFKVGDDVMAVPMGSGGIPGRAVRLFQARGTTGLAVTSDGERFLVAEPRGQQSETVSVLRNWTPEARR